MATGTNLRRSDQMLLRETQNSGPRPAPVLFSLAVHFALLSWVALSPRGVPEQPKSLYRRVFEPNEKKLVWYRFARKLPEISSPDPEPESKQMRAETLHPQTMVSRPKMPEPGKQINRAVGQAVHRQDEGDVPVHGAIPPW